MKKFTALFLALAFLFTAAPYDIGATGITASGWMSGLDDDLLISEINIPGSHDAGTAYVNVFSYFSVCQDLTIEEQLNAGVRYLDIRLYAESETTDRLRLVHGISSCRESANSALWDYLYFDKVLEWVYNFLSSNEDETVIMCIMQEQSSLDAHVFQNLLYNNYISKNTDKWYLDNSVPKLSQARGKIVLVRRYGSANNEVYTNSNCGIDFTKWPDQSSKSGEDAKTVNVSNLNGTDYSKLHLQDNYKTPANVKWNLVKKYLDQPAGSSEYNEFFINFLSTSGSGLIGQPKTSLQVNENFSSYTLNPGTRYGWLIFDFVTEELAEKVYMTNFINGISKNSEAS